MATKIVPVKLNDEEQEMLKFCKTSETRGALNSSELFRLLLHREYARRKTGKSVVKSEAISSDFRSGRPRRWPKR